MRIATALLALVSPVVFLVLLEAVAVVARVQPLAANEHYRANERIVLCKFRYRQAHVLCDPARVTTSRARLVIALGGSTVQGYPVGKVDPFPRQLEGMLEAAHPGEYAVVNRGLMCKDSTYVRQCAERVIAARPALLVVYSGHNSYSNWGFDDPAAWIFFEDHAWLFDLARVFTRSRAFTAGVRLWGTAAGGPAPEPSDAEFAQAGRVILERYTADLSAVIALAGRAGTEVVLVTVVSNLHEFPIGRSRWGEPLPEVAGSARQARWRAHYAQGIAAFGAGRFAEALAAFARARDEWPLGRAPSELNERIRELARTHAHVHLVDFARDLEQLGREEGIGCNFFGDETYCDLFHPNTRTHRLIAEAVFRKIEALRAPL
jgi:lysophospholipase L1-like esterase